VHTRGGPVGLLGGLLAVVLLAAGCSGDGSTGQGGAADLEIVRLAGNISGPSSSPRADGLRLSPPATAASPAGRVGRAGPTPVRPSRPSPAGSQPRSLGVRLGPVRPPAGPQCTGPGWEQRRGATILARIRYPYWGLSFSIEFLGARNGYLGFTSYADRRIEVYVRPCSQQSDAVLMHTIAHEIGHAVDYTFGDVTRRARWQRIRGIPADTPWYGCFRCTDYNTPAGDFAESFAFWQVGSAGYRSTMAGPPSPAQLRALGATFWP